MPNKKPNRDTVSEKRKKAHTRLRKTELIERLLALERPREHASSGHDSALTDSEERIRAILQTAVEGIITIDDRGIIESLNPTAERIFGYEAGELTGQNVSLLMPSPFREEHDHYIAGYLRTGHARIIGIGREVLGLRKDGSVFPMELSVSEVRLAKTHLFTGFVRDITDRKRTEGRLAELARSLSEKNRELETMVYIASHDLRSPLVNIQGFSKELGRSCERVRELIALSHDNTVSKTHLQSLVETDIPEAISFIQAGVAKMDALLSGFLRFSRLGRVALRIETLNMVEIMAGIARTMDYQLKEAKMTLRIASLPNCRGDSAQVNQVFTNLLDNAIKYRSPLRKGLIEISGRIESQKSIYSVRDNGIGIAPEHQDKAFEIFHQLDPSRGDGEGLGLAIAQRILNRQNGRIWLESSLGHGSTFHVSLPREPEEQKPKTR